MPTPHVPDEAGAGGVVPQRAGRGAGAAPARPGAPPGAGGQRAAGSERAVRAPAAALPDLHGRAARHVE